MKILFAALILLTVAAYSRSMYAPFVFDDDYAIAKNPSVNGSAPVSLHAPRSVLTTTYRINYWLDPSPFWFHVVNLALHIANGVLLFLIARNLVGDCAVVAAAVFWLHPLMSEGVIYVSARSELLSAFFGLAALGVFMGPRLRLIAAPLALLAIFSKESAAVYLALMAWYWIWKHDRIGWIAAAPVAALALIALLQKPAFEYATTGALDHAIHQAGGLARYLMMVPFPLLQSVDHDTASIPLGYGAVALGGMLIVLAVLVGARKRWPVPALAAVWVAIAVAPRFIVNTYEFMAERHMYLPMAGIAILVAGVVEIYQKKRSLAHGARIPSPDVPSSWCPSSR